MARGTPTREPPEFPDEELMPEESAPSGRQLLRMFIPVAAAIVIFITALLLVLKFLVIPAMDRSDPAVQARALATIGALQTREAATRAQQALTPQPTSTPQPMATAQSATQPTGAPTTTAAGTVANPTIQAVAVSTPAVPPATNTTQSASSSGAQTPSTTATPVQVTTGAGTVPTVGSALGAPAALPTVDPVAQAEVLQAYGRYWDQRALAFRDLDASLLNDVAAGPELDGLADGIDQLRSEGRAIKTHVRHHVSAFPTAPGEAVVADEYEDLSVYIDASTKEPLDPATADPQSGPVVKVRVVLQKIDGVWKVTGGRLYE
jgi:hypothetical protein